METEKGISLLWNNKILTKNIHTMFNEVQIFDAMNRFEKTEIYSSQGSEKPLRKNVKGKHT